jgi:hypothetical protein
MSDSPSLNPLPSDFSEMVMAADCEQRDGHFETAAAL